MITIINGIGERSWFLKKEGFAEKKVILGSSEKSGLFGSRTRRKLGPLHIAGFRRIKTHNVGSRVIAGVQKAKDYHIS